MIKRLQDFVRKDDAVIEVFSEILLTGIIVIAIAAAAAFVLSSLDEPDNVRVDIDHWVDNETDTLYFRHSGGEIVDVEDLELVVYVNGSYETLTSSQFNYDSDEWALGDVIEINTSSYDIDYDNVPSKLVHTASSLVIYDAYGSIGDSGADNGGNGGDDGGDGDGGDGDGGDGDLATAPVLSGPYPSLTYNSTDLENVTFNATSNQSSNNEFLLNGTRVKWSNNTKSPFYNNTTPSVGTYNLTLIAHNQTNPSLTDSITWIWNVFLALPPGDVAYDDANGNGQYDDGEDTYTIDDLNDFDNETVDLVLEFDDDTIDFNGNWKIDANSITFNSNISYNDKITFHASENIDISDQTICVDKSKISIEAGGQLNATDSCIKTEDRAIHLESNGDMKLNRSTIDAGTKEDITANLNQKDYTLFVDGVEIIDADNTLKYTPDVTVVPDGATNVSLQ